jgi:hypothetical protein
VLFGKKRHAGTQARANPFMVKSGWAQNNFSLEQFAFITVFRQSQQLFVGPDFDGGFHDEAKRAGNEG